MTCTSDFRLLSLDHKFIESFSQLCCWVLKASRSGFFTQVENLWTFCSITLAEPTGIREFTSSNPAHYLLNYYSSPPPFTTQYSGGENQVSIIHFGWVIWPSNTKFPVSLQNLHTHYLDSIFYWHQLKKCISAFNNYTDYYWLKQFRETLFCATH